MADQFQCTTTICKEIFLSRAELEAHCRALEHGDFQHPSQRYCQECNIIFRDQSLLQKHIEGGHHSNWCFVCSVDFKTPAALQAHNHGPKHHEKKERRCFICERDFGSAQALLAHNNSLAHVNRHINCRVAGCDKMLKSPSGTAHHLESNVHKHIHRHQITAIAQSLEIIPSISLRTIAAGDDFRSVPIASYVATAASWNGTHFACYLCDKVFKELGSLNQHLNSAAHDADEFKCPNCNRHFTLISGFVQHLESESCKFANLPEIQFRFDDLSAQLNRLLA